MEKRIGEIQRKYKRRSGLGPFFLGSFIGILLGVGLVVGLGFYAYKNVTPNWINKTFKTDLDLGSDELNSLTISKAIEKISYISNNKDTYTLADFERDFGYELPKEIKGINIEKLKTKPLDKIGEGVNDILNDVSVNELNQIYTPSADMDDFLSDTLTLYVKLGYNNGDKVYADKACTEEVAFAEIKNGGIQVKDVNIMPTDHKANFQLKDIPLLQGLPLYINHIGDNMTISRLESKFGISLPSIIKMTAEEKAEKTINELGDVIDNMYLADFLDYEYDELTDKVYKTVSGAKTEVTGAVAKFAKKKVKELNTLETTIQEMKVYEVLDYSVRGGKYYDGSTEVTGIMGKIAGYTVGTLSGDIQNLTIADILDLTNDNGTWKDKNGNAVKGVIKAIATVSVGNMDRDLQQKIDDMKIADVLDYTINSDGTVTDENGNQVKGVLKAIASLQIGTMGGKLQTTINGMLVADVLNFETDGSIYYTDKNSNGSYDAGEEITGIMATIANTTVGGLSDKIEHLKIYEALSYTKDGSTYKDSDGKQVSGVLSLIDLESEVANLSKEITIVFNGDSESGRAAKTLGELEAAGVVSLNGKGENEVAPGVKVKDMTVQAFFDAVLANI